MKSKLSLNKKKLLHLKDDQMAALMGGHETSHEPEETSSKLRCFGEDQTPSVL